VVRLRYGCNGAPCQKHIDKCRKIDIGLIDRGTDFEEEQEMQPKPESFSTAYAETFKDQQVVDAYRFRSPYRG